jgi:hypothetical protein
MQRCHNVLNPNFTGTSLQVEQDESAAENARLTPRTPWTVGANNRFLQLVQVSTGGAGIRGSHHTLNAYFLQVDFKEKFDKVDGSSSHTNRNIWEEVLQKMKEEGYGTLNDGTEVTKDLLERRYVTELILVTQWHISHFLC